MTGDEQPKILFVEDETSIAEPFAKALERAGFEPLLAGTIKDALVLTENSSPDLALLDLGLPDGDGLNLCRHLRKTSQMPIIIVTARGTETDRISGLEIGADDYVVKPFSGAEVIARIKAVLRRTERKTDHLPESTTIGPLVIDRKAHHVTLSEGEVTLTRKEFDLLDCLVVKAGEVVTREDLMSEVWDTNWFGSTKTLDVHIGLLRRKLEDDPANPRLIHTVRGIGFRFSGPEELE